MPAGGALLRADFALLSDLNRRVALPRLTTLTPVQQYTGVTVQFAGDKYGTPFRGESEVASWDVMARYGVDEQQQLADLLELFKEAATGPDPRLYFRTGHARVAGLDVAQAVVVFNPKPLPQPGFSYDLSFTANAVEYTLDLEA